MEETPIRQEAPDSRGLLPSAHRMEGGQKLMSTCTVIVSSNALLL
jgi:hypothetical protein